MKLPNGERAEISSQKLIGYCLNPEHPRGKHKARVFQSVLGIGLENVEELLELIQRDAIEGEVTQQTTTQFGSNYRVDWIVPNNDDVTLRTIWEVTTDRPNPRLVSAFLKL